MTLKRILSVVLAAVMIAVAVPITATAETEGYYTYTLSNGEVRITDVDTSINGDVVIPDTFGGYPVTIIGSSAFSGCSSLTSITIPEGVVIPRLGIEDAFASGIGTANDPYIIETAEQLSTLSTIVKLGSTCEGLHFKLAADIVLNDISNVENWSTEAPENTWTPIGYNGPYGYDYINSVFSGTFDGDGHNVSGIYINTSDNYCGLFGKVLGGTVKNVGVKDSYICGDLYVGGVVGDLTGMIENCYNTGDVSGDWDVGGVVGNSTGTVKNCYNTGNVIVASEIDYGPASHGGVVGAQNGGIVDNCYNTGDVSGTASGNNINVYFGGVVGRNFDGSVTNCHNTGSVSGQVSETAQADYFGGICGENINGTVENCHNMGTVTGISMSGGIVGRNYEGTVSCCYNMGDIAVTAEKSASAGGIVGQNVTRSTVDNCYNTGNIAGYENTFVKVGGLVGENLGTVSTGYSTGLIIRGGNNDALIGFSYSGAKHCYYLDLGRSSDQSYYGTALTEDQMKLQESFEGFNFAKTWAVGKTKFYDYPTLQSNAYAIFCDGDHAIIQVAAKAPTCTEIGWDAYEKCTVCDYTTYVEISRHVNTEIRNAVEPTEDTEGYSGDTYCKDCGALVAEGEVIPKLFTPGDANGDKKINISDVTMILKYIARWDVEVNTYASDVNKDDRVNISDVTLLLKYIAKWDVELK